MNHGLIAASLAAALFLSGACTNDPAPPRPDAAAEASTPARTDASTPEATVSPAAEAGAPDLPGADAATPDAGGTDLPVERPAADGPNADLPAPDLVSRDTMESADTTPDLAADTADAGPTCGAAVSRAMLCTTYCQGIATLCTGANRQFATPDQCRAACDAPTSTWACGTQGETTGNSLFCRLAHLVLAGVGAAALECPNAGPGSPACQ
jgi:hypothetical protein